MPIRRWSYALPFLGADGPRTYLVMGENNAEMRDQGCHALLLPPPHDRWIDHRTDRGQLSATIELHAPVPGVSIPSGTEEVFGNSIPPKRGNRPMRPPISRSAVDDMQYMFATAAGTDVNGVIGIDVSALQALLGLTGPVTVPGIAEPITAQNAADVLLDQLYQGLPPGSSQASRHEDLAAVASAVFHQLQVGRSMWLPWPDIGYGGSGTPSPAMGCESRYEQTSPNLGPLEMSTLTIPRGLFT